MYGVIKKNKKIAAKSLLSFLVATSFISAPAHADLKWSTFMGGSSEDRVTAVTTTPSGEIVLTGITYSSNFPTTVGAYDKTLAPGGNILPNIPTLAPELTAQDIYVTRLSADGKTVIFSTLLGGNWNEIPNDVVFDSIPSSGGSGGGDQTNPPPTGGGGSSSPYIVAHTMSVPSLHNPTGGPVGGGGGDEEGPPKKNPAGGNPGGGGTPTELIYIGGVTSSRDFPITAGAIDSKFDVPNPQNLTEAEKDGYAWQYPEGFVTALDGKLGKLSYSTYLGGSQSDSVQALTIAKDHDVIAVGSSDSLYEMESLMTKNFVKNYSYSGGFIARISPAGKLIYGSLVGGRVNDVAMIDDDAVMVGHTHVYNTPSDTSLPLKGGFGQTPCTNAFIGYVMRVTPSATVPAQNQLKFSSVLCGVKEINSNALSVVVTKDGNNDLIIAGTVGYTGGKNNSNPLGQIITSGAFETTVNTMEDVASYYINSWYAMYNSSPFQGDSALFDSFGYFADLEQDIYILKMKSDGVSTNPILYASYFGGGGTYLGSDGILPGRGLAIDSLGRVILAGYTSAYNFPVTPGAIDATPIKPFHSAYDVKIRHKHMLPFVSVLDMKKQGQKDLVYSTFLGSEFGITSDVEVLADDSIIAVGRTQDSAFPTTLNTFKQNKTDTTDGFVTKLDTIPLPSGKFGLHTDSTYGSSFEPLFGPLKVNLDLGTEPPTLNNPNFKLKLTDAVGLEGKNVTLYVSPSPLIPALPSTFGGTYISLNLFSQPSKIIKIEGTINANGDATFKFPLTASATIVKNTTLYAQGVVEKNKNQGKFAVTNAVAFTVQ